MKTKLTYFFALILLSLESLSATTYFVRSSTGSDTNNGTSLATALKTMGAIPWTNLQDGDIIDLSGTFDYNESRVISKSITIKGDNKATTIIQGTTAGAAKNCFIIGESSSPTVIIENVTFQNFLNWSSAAGTTVYEGGAILFKGGNLTCKKSNFLNNVAYLGGAIGIRDGGTAVIEDCYFYGNMAKKKNPTATNAHGGAIHVQTNTAAISLTINRCLFEGNSTELHGSSLRIKPTTTQGFSVLIQNSTFTGNVVKLGGNNSSGVMLIDPTVASASHSLKIINNTISFNRSEVVGAGGVGIRFGNNAAGEVELINNIFYSNTNASDPVVSSSISCIDRMFKTSYNNIIGEVYDFNLKTLDIVGSSSGNQSEVSESALALATVLADNGGETKTLALSEGSVAINAGYTNEAPTIDQTGYSRTTPDVGAYEWRGITSIWPYTLQKNIHYSLLRGKVIFEGLENYNNLQVYTTTGQLIQSKLISAQSFEFSADAGVFIFSFSGINGTECHKIILIK